MFNTLCVCSRSGRLLTGGEPDFHAVSVNIINDYQRGKLPYFVAPPLAEGETPKSVAAEPTVKASFEDAIKAAAEAKAAKDDADEDELRKGGSADAAGEASSSGKKSKKGDRSSKKAKALTKTEEEAAEDLAAIEAEEAARIGAFEDDPDCSDLDDDDQDRGRNKGAKSATPSTGKTGGATGVGVRVGETKVGVDASAGKQSKKRKAAASAEAEDVGIGGNDDDIKETVVRKKQAVAVEGKGEVGGRKSKRSASAMDDKVDGGTAETAGDATGGRRKTKKGKGVMEQGVMEEDEEEEDVVEDDDGAMPSIGEGLAWDDLS